MNEEDPSATALRGCRRLVPPCYAPKGDSPLSLLATVLLEEEAAAEEEKAYSKLMQ